jgi:hypothetical protein
LVAPNPPPPPPGIDRVSETPGSCSRMSRAIRSMSDAVAARLDPTGSRTEIWNRDSSSLGVKLIPDILNSGNSDAMTIAQTPTMTQR